VELWREYAEATRNHVKLLKEQERRQSPDSSAELEPEISLAGLRRETARAGIRTHLALHHANESSRSLTAG
jgi:hypothetical protein